MASVFNPSPITFLALISFETVATGAGLCLAIAAGIHQWWYWWTALENNTQTSGRDSKPQDLRPWLLMPRFYAFVRLVMLELFAGALWEFWRDMYEYDIGLNPGLDVPSNTLYGCTIIFGFITIALAGASPFIFFEHNLRLHAPGLSVVHELVVLLASGTTTVLLWVADYWLPGFLSIGFGACQILTLWFSIHFFMLRDYAAVSIHPFNVKSGDVSTVANESPNVGNPTTSYNTNVGTAARAQGQGLYRRQ